MSAVERDKWTDLETPSAVCASGEPGVKAAKDAARFCRPRSPYVNGNAGAPLGCHRVRPASTPRAVRSSRCGTDRIAPCLIRCVMVLVVTTHPLWRPFRSDANAARQGERVATRQTVPGPLHTHDREWRKQFERIRRVLLLAVGPRALSVRHVGSTSVPILDTDTTLNRVSRDSPDAKTTGSARGSNVETSAPATPGKRFVSRAASRRAPSYRCDPLREARLSRELGGTRGCQRPCLRGRVSRPSAAHSRGRA